MFGRGAADMAAFYQSGQDHPEMATFHSMPIRSSVLITFRMSLARLEIYRDYFKKIHKT